MNKQTADYISLKPLADRFREVANSISDDEIKNIIVKKIEEKVDEQLDEINIPLEEIVNYWFEDDNNINWVIDNLKESIENKFLNKKSRWW